MEKALRISEERLRVMTKKHLTHSGIDMGLKQFIDANESGNGSSDAVVKSFSSADRRRFIRPTTRRRSR